MELLVQNDDDNFGDDDEDLQSLVEGESDAFAAES